MSLLTVNQGNSETIKDKVIKSGDIVYFSAIENLWNGSYVRSRGYRRELSYWLSKIGLEKTIKGKQIPRNLLKNQNETSFTIVAKEIISNDVKTKNQKAQELVTSRGCTINFKR